MKCFHHIYIYNLVVPNFTFAKSSFPYLSIPNWCLYTVSSVCIRNTNPWKSLSQRSTMEETNKPKTKTKPKKSHSEILHYRHICKKWNYLNGLRKFPKKFLSSSQPLQILPPKVFFNQSICWIYLCIIFKMSYKPTVPSKHK